MKLTVAEVLSANANVPRSKWVYAVYVNDIPLYVGQAVEPIRRLRQHFSPPGCIAWHKSPLTELARDNWDEALTWTIELTEYEGDLNVAEADMIRALRPCLNGMHNPGGHALPKRLTTKQRRRDTERIRKIGARRSVL